ncbi:hypothetical protein HJC23_012761 [Cyclotella cryptica]|uniref:DUF1990 domain-containing protein n=1 Tax=Cyclotella cryptica TaxID=29204 RepID=A0ABD3Q594_9STRA|eukprot:CCRYP_008973-RB/>CCRYP_008973-RB protein AED:0.01 eAED:0.01 QI:459/1/1/1/0.33/0.25/4/4049/196
MNGETICRSDVIDGWRVLRFYKRLGYGEKCYRRLQHAVFNWNFEALVGDRAMGIVAAATREQKVRAQDTDATRHLLATFTEIRFPRPFKSLFIVNPVHVVRERRDVKRQVDNCVFSSTSYATLQGHLLAGEEKVTVIWRNGAGNEVDVEIVSCSRSAPSLAGKAIWPLIGRMQKQFFLAEMDHFDSIAKAQSSFAL